jgi:GDP-4-dehydro-6-deoxy-D-mannose reductase
VRDRLSSPILVTGAAGFVGGHLLDLLTKGATPIVGWNRPDAPPTAHLDDVRWVSLEMLDREAVGQSIREIQPSAVYHLAGAAHVGQSFAHAFETYQVNVLATHRLFDALRAARLQPRVLIAGSAAIYQPQDRPIREDDPISGTSPYATSKLAQEMLARRAWEDDGVPTLLARSFNHIGPRQAPSFVASRIARQIALIEAGREPPVITLGNLEPKRDLSDVRDTVRAYAAMMERATPGRPYNVCSGNGLAIRELVNTLRARARAEIQIAQDPSLFRPNDPPLLVGDHSRLTADTEWQPEIPFERTLADLLDYWRGWVAGTAAH